MIMCRNKCTERLERKHENVKNHLNDGKIRGDLPPRMFPVFYNRVIIL